MVLVLNGASSENTGTYVNCPGARLWNTPLLRSELTRALEVDIHVDLECCKGR